jgi:hydrogenase nickel incorporation protein HypB
MKKRRSDTMCTTCGCGEGDTRIEGKALDHPHARADGTVHAHPHHHEGEHAHPHESGALHWHRHAEGTPHSHVHGGGSAHPHDLAPAAALPDAVHTTDTARDRIVQVEQDILAKNDAYARENRRHFADHGIFALNLVSSPGSGKTTLLVRTIEAWQGRTPIAVIEGDQQTSRDADRVRATGAAAIQINTGKGCHLDAHMVGQALEELGPAAGGLLLIENVGNLVCPAEFNVGEDRKAMVYAVTEGEEKPLKYPVMFRAADVVVVNKIDLLPHLDVDLGLLLANIDAVNPDVPRLLTSARTGEGVDALRDWLVGVAARERVAT